MQAAAIRLDRHGEDVAATVRQRTLAAVADELDSAAAQLRASRYGDD